MSDDTPKGFGRKGLDQNKASTPAPQSADAEAKTSSPVPQTRALIKNHTELGELFKITLTNLALTILTLGIYRFWAKTRLRQYLWSHVEVQGDRLEYTGTGKELFLGFLFVFIVILLPLFGGLGVIGAMTADNETAQVVIGQVQLILIIFFMGAAFYRARRYRLTRTHWRGIYGNQTGSAIKYGLMGLASYFLTGITAGFAWPACSVWLKRYEMDNTWIGNQQPEFTPQVKKLYDPFIRAWASVAALMLFGSLGLFMISAGLIAPFLPFLLIFAVFFAFLWYRGKAYNHFVSSTRFVNHDVISAITGGGFAWLTVGNALIMILSLTLAAPFVYRRYLDFVENTVALSGDGDFSAISQGEMAKPTTGEGLADAFDVGAI